MKPASLLRRLGAILYDSLLVIALMSLGTVLMLNKGCFKYNFKINIKQIHKGNIKINR